MHQDENGNWINNDTNLIIEARNVKKGRYIAVYDDGFKIYADCMVDMKKKEVLKIETLNHDSGTRSLSREYIEVDGQRYILADDDNDPKKFFIT